MVTNIVNNRPLVYDRESIINVWMDNMGKTPALHVKSTADLFVNGQRWPFQKKLGEASTSVIGIRGLHVYGTKLMVQPPDALKPDIKTLDIRIKGIITYDDILRDSHATTFCVMYEATRSKFAFCQDGNEVY